jgi:hypothetical protein
MLIHGPAKGYELPPLSRYRSGTIKEKAGWREEISLAELDKFEESCFRDRRRDIPVGVHRINDDEGFIKPLRGMLFNINERAWFPSRCCLEQCMKATMMKNEEFTEVPSKSFSHLIRTIHASRLNKLFEEEHIVGILPNTGTDVPIMKRCPIYSTLDPRCMFHTVTRDQIHIKSIDRCIEVGMLSVLFLYFISIFLGDAPGKRETFPF